MADQSGSTRFQALFESALQAYKEKTRCNRYTIIFILGVARAFIDLCELLQQKEVSFFGQVSRPDMVQIAGFVGCLSVVSLSSFFGGMVHYINCGSLWAVTPTCTLRSCQVFPFPEKCFVVETFRLIQ